MRSTKNLQLMLHMKSNTKKHFLPLFHNTKHMIIGRKKRCFPISLIKVKRKIFCLKHLHPQEFSSETPSKNLKVSKKQKNHQIKARVLKDLNKKALIWNQQLKVDQDKQKVLKLKVKMSIQQHKRCFSPQKRVQIWPNFIHKH